MAIPPIRYTDGTDWVLTTAGIRPYPKAAHELMELAESRGWWIMNGLPVRVAPDGTHRIRVELGRSSSGGLNGYRYMILWTSEVEVPHAQFHVNKIFAISTEWNGWISVPGTSDVMAKINRFPLTAAPVLRDHHPGTGADQTKTKIEDQCYGRA
jgi:hypothetical protein